MWPKGPTARVAIPPENVARTSTLPLERPRGVTDDLADLGQREALSGLENTALVRYGQYQNELVSLLEFRLGRTVTDDEVVTVLRAASDYKGGRAALEEAFESIKSGLGTAFKEAAGALRGGLAPPTSFKFVPLAVIFCEEGFRIPAIQAVFKNWQKRQLATFEAIGRTKTNPLTGSAYTLDEWVGQERFVVQTSHGRARFLLDLLLGPNIGTRVATSRRSVLRWAGRNEYWVRGTVSANSNEGTVAAVQLGGDSLAAWTATVRSVIEDPMNNVPKPRNADDLNQHPTQFMLSNPLPTGDAEAEAAARFVMAYLARYAPGGDIARFDITSLQAIIGRKAKIEPKDFVHAVLEARHIFRYEAEIAAEVHTNVRRVVRNDGAVDPLIEMLHYGFDDKIRLCIQNSGYEHGNLHEIAFGMALVETVEESAPFLPRGLQLDEAGTKVLDEDLIPSSMSEQFTLGGRASCDWMLRIAARILRIEAKSNKSGLSMTGFGGSIWTQTASHFRRLYEQSRVAGSNVTWVRGQNPKVKIDGTEEYVEEMGLGVFVSDRTRLERDAYHDIAYQDGSIDVAEAAQLLDDLPGPERVRYATTESGELGDLAHALNGPGGQRPRTSPVQDRLRSELELHQAIGSSEFVPNAESAELWAAMRAESRIVAFEDGAQAWCRRLTELFKSDASDAFVDWLISSANTTVRHAEDFSPVTMVHPRTRRQLTRQVANQSAGRGPRYGDIIAGIRDNPAAHREGMIALRGLNPDELPTNWVPDPLTNKEAAALLMAINKNDGAIDFTFAGFVRDMPDAVAFYHLIHSPPVSAI